MAYQIREGVEQRQLYSPPLVANPLDPTVYFLLGGTQISRDGPKIPDAFIIDRIRREQEERERRYDDHRPQPSLYDDYYRQPPQPEQKKDEGYGVVIVDMTVTSSHSLLEQML